ncbi:MAG: AMP-binding protein [Oscillospiraceae bacterium]|jgi:acetyl-CoA synthetase|nr:AMP-binding protein [Oscillospiraceae bacterium]
MNVENFYKQFCTESFDERGVLSSYESIYPESFNFAYDVVDKIAEMEPDRRAMVWCNVAGEERVFTFSDMMRYSNKVANYFVDKGVKKGDMVMLILKRHYQFWFAVLALHKIGAVGVPGTNLLMTKDYEYRFDAAGVKHIVCTSEGEVTARVEEACTKYTGLVNKFVVKGARDGWLDFDSDLEGYADTFTRMPTAAEDPMLLYFTSGTTGMPKMVFHDHSYPLAHIITAKYWHNVDPNGLHLTVSETGWMKSMWGKLYGQWLIGTAVFVYDFDKFVPGDLLAVISKHKVTSFCAPPTIYRFFIKENTENFDFSSVKYATTAGEALNPEVYNRFMELTGLHLMEAFGQTETTVLTLNLVGTTPKPGSMGKPSPLYNVDLVDEDGQSVPPGEVGEIVIRVPAGKKQNGLFGGYFKDPELTKTVWYDGMYHTGDTAWKDEDGFFWYVGRTDDIIKSSGYRIGPFEIESVLMEHPAVLECAVTGAPDPDRGTVVKATVVLTQSYSPGDALKKELQDYVKKQTAPYKYPRILEFVPELPKTISGKIKRADIRKG